jgi:hypothetical protein
LVGLTFPLVLTTELVLIVALTDLSASSHFFKRPKGHKVHKGGKKIQKRSSSLWNLLKKSRNRTDTQTSDGFGKKLNFLQKFSLTSAEFDFVTGRLSRS